MEPQNWCFVDVSPFPSHRSISCKPPYIVSGVYDNFTTQATTVSYNIFPETNSFALDPLSSFWKGENGELHVDCWRMSGNNCLHTVVPAACNWWYLSNLLFEQQARTYPRATRLPRPADIQDTLQPSIEQEEFPPVDENILVGPPKKTSKKTSAKSGTSTWAQKAILLMLVSERVIHLW